MNILNLLPRISYTGSRKDRYSIMKISKFAKLSVTCAALLAAGFILETGSAIPAFADQTVSGQSAAASGISYEGLLLTVDGHTIDLAAYETLTDVIMNAYPYGDWVIAEGHVNPHRSNYFLYNRNSGMVDHILSGANLTWARDDITTAVYSAFNEVYDFKGNVIGTTIAEVDSISLNADGTEATVTDSDGAAYTFEVDQSDRAIYRYTDYLKAPGPGRWAALAETAPKDALALVIVNPPADVGAFLPAVSVVDADASDVLFIIPLQGGTTIRLDDAEYDPASGDFRSTGTITEVKPAKGGSFGVQITVPEGVPSRLVYVSAGGAYGMFPVSVISGATDKCSTFITGTAAGSQAASGKAGTESAFDAADSYMDLLFKYKEAEQGAYSEEQLEAIKLHTELRQHGWPGEGTSSAVSYRFFDVNGDGVNELIISYYGNIIDIYAVGGGHLNYAYGGLYRGEASLHEGGLLEELFAPSMNHASTTWYRFDPAAGFYFPAFRRDYKVTQDEPEDVHYYTFPYETDKEGALRQYLAGGEDREWMWKYSSEITKEAYDALCATSGSIQLPEGSKFADFRGL